MKRKMLENGIWEKPICIEENHFLILDGQHRYEVASELGLKYIPCEFFDYNDESLLVWSLRKECAVSKHQVIERALRGDIYPYKTAKHKFPQKVEKVKIPLEGLHAYSKTNEEDIIDYEPTCKAGTNENYNISCGTRV
ncbi:MAG: ParB N-terminal domain-containing protein [Planctomycetes bacterium]|nr:ParB N-terminal domain-containing protein [Planctomycetota bacterium]